MKALRQSAAFGLVLSLVLAALASCDNTYGFYKTIQEEKATVKDSTFYRTSVRDLVPFDGSYYSPLVAIYARTLASGTAQGWAAVSIPVYLTDYTTYGMAATSTTLYAALQSGHQASTDRAIFSLAQGGTAWTRMADFDGVDVKALYSVNDTLFAVRATSTTVGTTSTTSYGLWYLSGSTYVQTSLPESSGLFIRGAYFNGEYWFAAQVTSTDTTSTIWHASDPTASWTALPSPPSSLVTCLTATLQTSAVDKLAMGCKDGSVYLMGTDLLLPTTGTLATLDATYSVTALIALPAGSKTILVAGSNALYGATAAGYRESDISTGSPGSFVLGDVSTASLATTSSYDSSLISMPISRFVYDAANKSLFACASASDTTYSGLWSNAYDGSTWGGWTSE